MITASGNIAVVVTNSEKWGYIVQHRAVIFRNRGKLYATHMTLSGPEILPLERFESTRSYIASTKYKLKGTVDIEAFNRQWNPEFNLLNNNCETYVNTFIDQYTTQSHCHGSQQIIFWSAVCLILITKMLIR